MWCVKVGVSIARGIWGHAPPENFSILDALKVNLVQLEMQKGHSDCMDSLKHCSFSQPLFYTRRCRACHLEQDRLQSTLIVEIDRLMCEKRHKRSTFGNSHLGAQTDTLTNCGTN